MTPHTEIFNELLKLAVENGASDIVIKANKPAYVRLGGRLKPVDMDPITNDIAGAFVEEHVPEVFRSRWDTEGQVDFAYAADGVGRFRVNGFHQRGLVSIVLRHIKSRVPDFEQLGLQSEALIRMSQAKDGILLVCGATGSGKSSTMAAMLNWINQNLEKHIVTIEDPIEYTFQDEKSVFQQREIGLDVPSFELAIKAVLRQNPDIILIGEMRDRETFETAISAAETGHLVFSTMHAATVAQSMTRLFEFFPPEEQVQARRQISGSLRGFVCQKLVPALEGGGRVPTNEILNADAVVKNLILEGQFEKIQGLLEGSADSHSFSFNKDIYRLIKAGKISKAEGLRYSPNPQALDMNLKGIFIKA
ncbi:PilT/PilU family type 4a pilus ATPase [Horticoccus luteus]|uniref:PilT/PilU family type 4a pilus ATPase n=1 Tax=Horticoccus luteus TaxID=2862869 RepID=A0A8F9TZ02_9BACT|nr:PilT/PilU family type 4a pilus ATPase [Horticoccus luteus]QYM80601.1 PilT/PilU family type 4a pilus ATPase [Horticoccus luteus]